QRPYSGRWVLAVGEALESLCALALVVVAVVMAWPVAHHHSQQSSQECRQRHPMPQPEQASRIFSADSRGHQA
ncbi:MAG: hypothetical protein ACK53L_24950, partial [Pirellulaceae bacterium]